MFRKERFGDATPRARTRPSVTLVTVECRARNRRDAEKGAKCVLISRASRSRVLVLCNSNAGHRQRVCPILPKTRQILCTAVKASVGGPDG